MIGCVAGFNMPVKVTLNGKKIAATKVSDVPTNTENSKLK
jgi:hypothetical protein